MLFSIGCTETVPGSIGEEVLPPEDTLGIVNTDTFSILLESRILDEVTTGDAPLALIGNYVDPELGRVSATRYNELRLTGVDLEFGEQLQFVSLELNLRVISYYGSLFSPQTLAIHKLTEAIPDSAQNLKSTSSALAVDPLNLAGNFEIDFAETGSVSDLVIPLDSSLGKEILFASTDDLVNDEAFQELIKGIAISTNPVGFQETREPGAIYYIDFESQETYLELTYSRFNTAANERVEESFNFRLNGSAGGYHTVSRGEIQNVRLLGFSGVEDDNMYEFIQAGALIKTYLNVPGINTLPQAAINRAVLTLQVEPEFLGGGNRYTPPGNLLAYRAGSDGNELRDEEGRPTLFGRFTYNSTDGVYQMDLAGHVQQVVSKRRENYGFILIPEDSSYTLNRAIFAGTSHPSRAPKLRLTYTTLP
ncbi:MAG: DUF4270 family protein [Bacteroidia bacterium]